LPSIDDGCASVNAALDCARLLVANGYTHAFCTPHIWPNLPENNVPTITTRLEQLQAHLARNEIALTLLPGGELNIKSLWPALRTWARDQIPTYAMAGRYVLFDFWARSVRDCRDALFEGVLHLRSLDLEPILAHPERITVLQENPTVIDELRDAGVLLQMNLWCLTEPADSPVYQTAVRLLKEGKYFMFGTDCHNAESLPRSIEGLDIARSIVGDAIVEIMTKSNPKRLIPGIR
jgi:protein-tyrosine phosphatase